MKCLSLQGLLRNRPYELLQAIGTRCKPARKMAPGPPTSDGRGVDKKQSADHFNAGLKKYDS
jgi:hypothetical protein